MTRTHRPTAAFTLVEIMVAMTIIGFVLVGVLPFFTQTSMMQFISTQKLLVNADVRSFTNGMIQDVESSGCFMLYQSFFPRTLADGTNISRDFNNDGVINAADRMQSGQSGDFLVLIYYQDPFYDSRFYDSNPNNQPTLGTATVVSRIIGYWLAPNRDYSGETALYRFDTNQFQGSGSTWTTPWGATFPATLSPTVTVESLLPAATQTAATDPSYASVVLNNLQGLAQVNGSAQVTGTASGLDFVSINQGLGILVRARILHGNQAKRVTNTYNFTVSPRG